MGLFRPFWIENRVTQLSHVHRTAIGAASMFSDADIHRAAKELVERYDVELSWRWHGGER